MPTLVELKHYAFLERRTIIIGQPELMVTYSDVGRCINTRCYTSQRIQEIKIVRDQAHRIIYDDIIKRSTILKSYII